MKRLLVISNHHPDGWSKEQKAGWDSIEFHQLPNVSPHSSTTEIIEKEKTEICGAIEKFLGDCDIKGDDGYISLQGESSVCYYVFDVLKNANIFFVFSTTERVSVEETLPDGSTKKISQFKFVLWR